MYGNAKYINDNLHWDTIIMNKPSKFGYAICSPKSTSPDYWGLLMNELPFNWTYFTFVRH